MKSLMNNGTLFKLMGLMLIFLICASGAIAKDQKDNELKKKYGPILGEYEFDLTDMGGETQTVSFEIRDGDIWADSGDGDPATMEPVEGAEFEFTVESSDGQSLEVKFVKDDNGKYTVCQILIVGMGMEIEGTKIK